MAIRTKEEILNSIKEIIGDNTDDNSLALIEDINDTYDDFTTRTNDSTNWKQKYEDNDKEWRNKYKERFYKGSTKKEEPIDDEELDVEDEKPKILTYENLFTEEDKK